MTPLKWWKNDKSGYKKNSKLWPILAGYLIPTLHFDNMIHITALMKTVRLRGPHKLPKTDVIDPEHYIANNDWNLWDFLACYLSQTMDIYMVHINAFMKTSLAFSSQGWEKTRFFEKTRDPRGFSKNMGFSLGFFKARDFSKYDYSETIYRPPSPYYYLEICF